MTFRILKAADGIVRAALFAAAVAASLASLLATPADAQTLWTSPAHGGRSSLELEMLRPSFSDEDLGFTGASGAAFLTARLGLGERWAVVADLPFARASWDVAGESGSSSLLGNPYVGAEWRANASLVAEAGARLPVGDLDDLDQIAAMVVGMAGEIERVEAFVPETLGVYAAASWRHALAPALTLRLRGGGAFLTGDGGPDDLLLGYTGQLWYLHDAFSVGSGLTGRANATTDDQDADRASHQWIVAGEYAFGQLRPGLQLRVPLDSDVRELAGYTLGLGFAYTFR